MRVIPGINEKEPERVSELLKKSVEFGFEWVQIDVSDGSYGSGEVSANPKAIKWENGAGLKLEIDLLVADPEEKMMPWLELEGVSRIIFHLETLTDPARVKELCSRFRIETGLSALFSENQERLKPWRRVFDFWQVLAVPPGKSGQEFKKEALEVIKFLREGNRNATIEVDGGINEETARLARVAGADTVASTSFIFSSPDARAAYEKLAQI